MSPIELSWTAKKESLSDFVSDKDNQWSDSGPIKTTFLDFVT